MTTLMLLYVGGALLLVLVSLPLLAEKVPPNPLYGFRVRTTLEDPKVWYAVNRFAARRLIFAGAAVFLAALGLYCVPGLSVDGYALTCLAIFVVAIGIALIQSFRYLRTLRLKRDTD